MKYKVRISQPNKIFIIKNSPIRTPFETIIDEKELSLVKSRIKFYGITEKDYLIIKIEEDTNINNNNLTSNIKRDLDTKNRKKVNEKLIFDVKKEENTQKPIQKVFKKEKKKSYKPQEKVVPIPTVKPKINIETDKNIEQIINNQVEEFKNSKIKEIRIEELSIKSSTILDKFLNNEV